MEIEIKTLTSQDIDDFIELIKVFEEVFEIKNFAMPGKEHLQGRLSNGNFLASVAKRDGKVIGGFTAYDLDSYYSEKPSAYIYDLAVLNEFQRQGIGKKLLHISFSTAKKKTLKRYLYRLKKMIITQSNFIVLQNQQGKGKRFTLLTNLKNEVAYNMPLNLTYSSELFG